MFFLFPRFLKIGSGQDDTVIFQLFPFIKQGDFCDLPKDQHVGDD